jgi:putative serine protease PepD
MSTRGRLDVPGRFPTPGPPGRAVTLDAQTPSSAPGTPVAPEPRRHRTTVVAIVTVGVVVVVALVLTAIEVYHFGSASRTAAPRPAPSASASAKDPTTADIYAAVAPSVVSIRADRLATKTADTGTGVIVNADGTIATASHVVHGADTLQVRFADGTTSSATVAADNPAMDVALLSPATLPSVVVPAVLGNPARLAVGDNVVAIGDPFGLTRTTTAGVVSGLNRSTTERDGPHLTGLIQFDAAVNPGNSGGPLLNGRGETVGIVVGLANPTTSDTFIGIGFAVPIGTAVAAGGGDRVPQQ